MRNEMGLTAGDVGVVALLGGHPQVGGARVEDHLEGLRRVADADGPVVLRLRSPNTHISSTLILQTENMSNI